MSAGLRLYYVIVFVVSAIPEDMEALTLFKVGSLQLYAIDIVHGLIVMSILAFIVRRKQIVVGHEARFYLIFLAWLLIEVVLGVMRFQFRALGEARYILPLFAFVVPFLLVPEDEPERFHKIRDILFGTIVTAGLAGVVMFFIEVLNGGRFFLSEINRQNLGEFEDFRGTRILGSTHCFNIMALGALQFFRSEIVKDLRNPKVLSAIALLIIALISKNRASIIAVSSAMLFLLVIQKRIKRLLSIAVTVAVVMISFGFFFPSFTDQMVTSITGALNPAEDQTGSWRLALNLSALDQALETPWLGQGYGGYFYFLIPGSRPEDAPPHNQFIILFLKAGLVGLVLCLLFLWSVFRRFAHLMRTGQQSMEVKVTLNTIMMLVFSQLPYGMAYNFVPLFGVYAGIAVMYGDILSSARLQGIENEIKMTSG